MDNMTAALVGGLFDESGISAYARPVLFGTAGDAVRDALPDAVEKCYFVHDEREPELAGAESLALNKENRFAALADLPECGHVLVLAAPFALAEEDALFHLAQTHVTAGYGVSVLSAEQQGFDAEGQPVPRDTRCFAALFTFDMLKKALESGADTLDGLVAAAVAAGAQKGVAITNKIYPINDGVASFMAQTTMMQRINFGLIKKGVQIFDPTNTYIAPDADIAPGAVILPAATSVPAARSARARSSARTPSSKRRRSARALRSTTRRSTNPRSAKRSRSARSPISARSAWSATAAVSATSLS